MASFKSFLSAIGNDFKKVFSFLSSPAGQAVVSAGEAVAEGAATAVNPAAGAALTGALALANAGLTEVIKTEALAAAAEQQSGTGAQKAAAVTAAITPQVLAYAQQNGLAAPTSTQIQTIVNSLVGFLNALPAPATTTTSAA